MPIIAMNHKGQHATLSLPEAGDEHAYFDSLIAGNTRERWVRVESSTLDEVFINLHHVAELRLTNDPQSKEAFAIWR